MHAHAHLASIALALAFVGVGRQCRRQLEADIRQVRRLATDADDAAGVDDAEADAIGGTS
jgi:hypothetical protein